MDMEQIHRRMTEMDSNVEKSFQNIKYDIQTINSWIFELYRNHSVFPQKFDEASQRIVSSLEIELNKLKELFEDFTSISARQLSRIEGLESLYDEMTAKMRNAEAAADRMESSLSSIDLHRLSRLSHIEEKLERVLARLEGGEEEKPSSTVYSSGTPGSKFHTRDCLTYRRLKSPKSYDSPSDARKAKLTVCKLCVPTDKRNG